jgi:hypothetical protein
MVRLEAVGTSRVGPKQNVGAQSDRTDHRDCGAAKLAYEEAAVANPAAETATHRKALAEFRQQLAERYPKLGVETGLMALDGTFEVLS